MSITQAVLEKIIKELTPAFALIEYRISYQKTEIATEQDAINNRFVFTDLKGNGNFQFM